MCCLVHYVTMRLKKTGLHKAHKPLRLELIYSIRSSIEIQSTGTVI